MTLTHMATIGTGDDAEEVTLRNVSVTVRVKDLDTRAVTVEAVADPLVVVEADRQCIRSFLQLSRPPR